jgi:hypothetical protein
VEKEHNILSAEKNIRSGDENIQSGDENIRSREENIRSSGRDMGRQDEEGILLGREPDVVPRQTGGLQRFFGKY